jgi:hypothetical protein
MYLGMAAEDVGPENLGGDPLLARIDDLGAGGRGSDLLEVTRLGDIAKDDSHDG